MPEEENKEIIFVESALEHSERFYCSQCFYHNNEIGFYSEKKKNHRELLEKYPKPIGTRCLIGRVGFYKQSPIF